MIVFDDVERGATCEALRARGKHVVGGTVYTDRLELDRDFGQSEMKAVGMTILPSWDFETFDAAIEHVRAHPDRYVVKPNGEAQNEKVLSYVGQDDDGKDVVSMLQFFKRSWSKKIHGFQLQKHASGVEVAVGAFFNGKDFLLPACVNFEHKRLFDGEIGPSTGEMGTSMFWANENRARAGDGPALPGAPGGRGLRRLLRPQLHRLLAGDRPARGHEPLRLPHDQHPDGRRPVALERLPRGAGPRRAVRAAHPARLPGRRRGRGARPIPSTTRRRSASTPRTRSCSGGAR